MKICLQEGFFRLIRFSIKKQIRKNTVYQRHNIIGSPERGLHHSDKNNKHIYLHIPTIVKYASTMIL